MTLRGLFLSWFSLTSLVFLASSSTHVAQAQCVQADVGVQYNISGSKEPTDRRNDVEMESNGSCRGNASVTVGVQGNEGGNGQVRQHRKVRHRFEGRDDDRPGGETVQLQSNPQIDVYNPAER